MPIRREEWHFDPIDWRELSAAIRFGRAKGRCERCGRPHGQLVYHLSEGRWFDDEACIERTFVPLACAHLDQDTANNADDNLAAFCQRCHLDHDRPWNLKKRRLTMLLRRALGDLFTGRYRR